MVKLMVKANFLSIEQAQLMLEILPIINLLMV
jgi:hypothetical protein